MKILVITTREIGDVLLSTALIHSLKQAYSSTHIDALVFAGKGGMLQGNPDLNTILDIAERPTKAQHYYLFKQIWQTYDLAISTLSGDRPLLYALIAAKQRIAPLEKFNKKNFWKYWVCQKIVNITPNSQHTMLQNQKLATQLQIPNNYQLIPPRSHKTSPIPSKPYVVLHLLPRWSYKRWPQIHWQQLALKLQQKYGWQIVLTGGKESQEQNYINEFTKKIPNSINLAGQLDLGQLTPLLQQAVLYVGPDTAITHLAATCCPTVALFGPTNPVIWSPWPQNWTQDQSPFKKVGSAIVNNVALVQGEGECVPCHQEGCLHHRQSHSRCLEQLSVEKVLLYIKRLLG